MGDEHFRVAYDAFVSLVQSFWGWFYFYLDSSPDGGAALP
jgi:hypothetical protein